MSFEANHGQTDPEVQFFARGAGYNVFLTSPEAVVVLSPIGTEQKAASYALRMRLLGASTERQAVAEKELPASNNYFMGSDPTQWRTNIPTFEQVRYRDVYPGIDLVYYGNGRQLEYDFVVAPGADPDAIQLSFTGARATEINSDGDLVLRLDSGDDGVRFEKPVVYQQVEERRQNVAAEYVLVRTGEVRFHLGPYDRTRPLVIDPVLSYSTYLGGGYGGGPLNVDDEIGWSVAVDGSGNAYVIGETQSPGFPTTNALQPAFRGGLYDAFVVKLNPAGQMIYSTYLGGASNDFGYGIVVDGAGNAYVTGETTSTNFPLVNPLQPVSRGFPEIFVTKLNANGSTLIYSTYLGGSDLDRSEGGIAVDTQGNAYVTGSTFSTDFPMLNAFQATHGGGGARDWDTFVTKLNAAGSALVYSTYLGGRSFDKGYRIAVDASGSAYVTGQTGSTNFPTAFPFKASLTGGSDGFAAKFNAAGNILTYSTYLGGSLEDSGNGVAVDASGNAYITGWTESTNFPTVNAAEPTKSGSFPYNGFVSKFNATGSALIYSTYLGRARDGAGIGVDGAGGAHVAGSAGLNTADADVLVASLEPSGSSVLYSVFGGISNDRANDIAVGATGNLYVTGSTASNTTSGTPFPTFNAVQPCYGGGYTDAFVMRLSPSGPPPSPPTVSAISPSMAGPGTTVNVTLSGTNFVCGSTTVNVSGTGITVGTVSVSGPASLTAALTISPSASPGPRNVTVTTPYGTSNVVTITVTTDTTAPTTPSNLTATPNTSSSIVLRWTASSDNVAVSEYWVERCQGAGCSNFSQVATVPASASMFEQYTDTGLTAATSYSYRVKAIDTSGNMSGYSNTATASTPGDTTPPVISAVTAGSIAQTGATITWTTNEPADSQVEYGTTTSYGQSTTLNASLVISHSVNLTGLTASTLYHFRVRSKDAAGNLSVSLNATFTTSASPPPPSPPPPPPPPPVSPPLITSVTISNLSSEGATVSWVTDQLSTTQVEYGQTTGYGMMTALDTSLVTTHSANLVGLASNTGYHYRVRSSSANGTLAVSVNFTFTTLSRPAGSMITYSIPNYGGQSWTLTDPLGLLKIGTALVQSGPGSSVPSGLAFLENRVGGVTVTEAAVPASPLIPSGRISVEASGSVNTGIAISNNNAQDVVITFYFTHDGADVGHGSFKLPAKRQFSAFLDQVPFKGPVPFNGSFSFVSSLPVGVVVLRGLTNERGDFLFTTLPVSPILGTASSALTIPNESAATIETVQVVPQFAAGGGWNTQVILTNPSDTTISGVVQFFGPGSPSAAAQPVQLTVNGRVDSSFIYSIPSHGTVRLVTAHIDDQIQSGSVRITPAAASVAPSAVAVFSLRQNGVTVTESSIGAKPAATAFTTYVESLNNVGLGGFLQSAVAIANPNAALLVVTLEMRRLQDGVLIETAPLTIPADGQVARFVKELFPTLPVAFQGTLRLSASTPFVVAGVRARYNERGDFLISTTPASNEAQTSGSGLVFPHIVSGQSYSTQLILFNSTAATAAGQLFYDAQSGLGTLTQPLQLNSSQ